MPKSSNSVILHKIDADQDMGLVFQGRSGASRRHTGHMRFACILSILFFSCMLSRVHGDLAGDKNGLIIFKQAVDKSNNLIWNASGDVCRWVGIKCNFVGSPSTQRVTKIKLSRAVLSGQIPTNSLGQITELRAINLRFNSLSGSLPSDLANCGYLRNIFLGSNAISGPLPSNFSVWPNLNNADFSFNDFNGSIPTSLADSQQLISLYLQNNSLSGSLPPLNMSSLANFDVSYNHLTGSIPITATYRKFNSSAFLGNNLCGFPLPACAPAPAPIPPPTEPSSHGKKLSGGAIAGIVLGAVALLLLLCLLCCLAYKSAKSGSTKQPNPFEVRSMDGLAIPEGDAVQKSEVPPASSEPDRKGLVFFEGNKYTFTLEDLLRASAEVLGKGSVGTSYKAAMEAGTIVAVKRLKDVSLEKKDFEQKMDSFGKLKHENLVPLMAYYYSREEKLLVSNYMTNGSLSALLHGNKEATRTPLDWDTRLRIAIGAAVGINHLHENGFTHGNIKSSNVLLTSNYTGCVSDYGLMQLVSASSVASRMVGYRAPEVTDIRKTTMKSDVYGFGVLLLEILTGKPPSHSSMNEEGLDLPRWVQSVSREEEDWFSKVFDPQLTRFEGAESEMVRVLDIALECIKPSPDQRPTTKQLVEMLESCKQHDGLYSP